MYRLGMWPSCRMVCQSIAATVGSPHRRRVASCSSLVPSRFVKYVLDRRFSSRRHCTSSTRFGDAFRRSRHQLIPSTIVNTGTASPAIFISFTRSNTRSMYSSLCVSRSRCISPRSRCAYIAVSFRRPWPSSWATTASAAA